MLNVDLIEIKENNNDILNFCKEKSGDIVIMPAGVQSEKFSEYLKSHSVKVKCMVDNSINKQGTKINGIPVISFDDYKRISADSCIVISTNLDIEKELIQQLKENNINEYKCAVADYIGYTSEEIDNPCELILNNMNEYIALYNILEDDLSRKTLKNRLNYLITYDNKYLEEILRPAENQYFEPSIYELTSEDYFVDCGAFDGDTLGVLMENVNHNIAGYYGFEPDRGNYSKILSKVADYDNTFIYNKGVFRYDTTLKFNAFNNAGSKLGDDGNVQVEVVSLDSCLKDKKVSFIKMDIEGGESDAILGAKNIIVNQKPVLAISVYHKFNDLYELPSLIENLGVSYKYYLRHYRLRSAETILYAIPE